MDFTVDKYEMLLNALRDSNYSFQTFDDFLMSPKSKSVILRHDVDLLPGNSLNFAKIQSKFGIKGSYYFRAVPESWNESIIREIEGLGHEIGYHYECLTTTNGDLKKGISDFEMNLTALRKLARVRTICMHGSPLSKHDSRDLWKNYKYADFDILGEPYFDIDFKKVYYLTDTGRKWDGDKVSVRDKVDSGFDLKFHSTDDIIKAARANQLPNQIMFTFHPQRWNNDVISWTKELVTQSIKNVVKKVLFVK